MKLSNEQRRAILKAFRQYGADAATALAMEHRITREHVFRLALKAGIRSRPVVSQVLRSESRMWERAKANGAVIA